MKGIAKVVKGRVEEAAGALIGNDKLRAKRQTDQAVGHIEQICEKCNCQTKKIVNNAINIAKKGKCL